MALITLLIIGDERKMNKGLLISLEEIVEQNEKRVQYHLYKLCMKDPVQEYFQESTYAMLHAYKTYQPDEGIFSTYFNYVIQKRLRERHYDKL